MHLRPVDLGIGVKKKGIIVKNLALLSYDLRKQVLDMIVAGSGGHIGGDMSVMEILVTLYMKQMNVGPENIGSDARDRFVLSKGHCVEAYYAVLAAKGFFEIGTVIHQLNRFDSPFIGHPNNKLPGIEMNSGSLGHGLSVTVGMALRAKRDQKDYRVYTVMGDGELAEGSIWEAAMAAGHYQLDQLCAVIDRNGLQISGSTEEVMSESHLRERFESFGWHVLDVENGNDITQLNKAFEVAKQVKGKPTLLIAHTVKGKGSKVMENKANWHHRVPTAEEYTEIVTDFQREKARITGVDFDAAAAKIEKPPVREKTGSSPLPVKNKIPNRQALCDVLLSKAEADKDILVICSDSRGSASLTPFADRYPAQFVEVGIAEQDLVGISAGLAKCGKKVFAASPAAFLTTRSYEQCKIDVAYSDSNVKLIGISGGISYGALGMSHHSTQDIAAMSALPNMRVYLPSDRFQTAALTKALLLDEKPAYIRLGRNPVEDIYAEADPFTLNQAVMLHGGKDLAIVACGEMVRPALDAAIRLEAEGIHAAVIDMYCVKPLDTDMLRRVCDSGVKAVLTVEEHSPMGGLGAMVSQFTAANYGIRTVNLSLPDAPVVTGNSREVFAYYGLSADGIAGKAKEILIG